MVIFFRFLNITFQLLHSLWKVELSFQKLRALKIIIDDSVFPVNYLQNRVNRFILSQAVLKIGAFKVELFVKEKLPTFENCMDILPLPSSSNEVVRPKWLWFFH